MNTRSKIVSGVLGLMVAVLVVFLITGCNVPGGDKNIDPPPAPAAPPVNDFLKEHYQTLSDGRTILCLFRDTEINGYSTGSAPSLSCDWANAVIVPPK